jgi:hypothetical protein
MPRRIRRPLHIPSSTERIRSFDARRGASVPARAAGRRGMRKPWSGATVDFFYTDAHPPRCLPSASFPTRSPNARENSYLRATPVTLWYRSPEVASILLYH